MGETVGLNSKGYVRTQEIMLSISFLYYYYCVLWLLSRSPRRVDPMCQGHIPVSFPLFG